MGHDVHFLSRLDRVSRDETDFALGLYRDHEAVRWILDRARVPPGADRIAIALSAGEDTPHLIVARDGGFVTCLARGMSVGDRPRVPRSELDRLVGEAHEFRVRWAVLQNEASPSWFYRRLFVAGSHIAREDFLPFMQLAPALGSTYVTLWAKQIIKLAERLSPYLAETQKKLPDDEFLKSYWSLYHSVEHLTLIVSVATDVFDRIPLVDETGHSPLPGLFWGLGRFGMHSGLARIAWLAARLGPVIRPGMFELLTGSYQSSRILTGWAVCAGLIASGATDLADAAARALEAPPLTDSTAIERIRRQCLQSLATYHAERDANRARAIDGILAVLDAVKSDALAARIRAGDPEHLAVAWLGGDMRHAIRFRNPGGPDVGPVGLGMPSLVIGLRAENFYTPRANLERLWVPWSREEAVNLAYLPLVERPPQRAVRVDDAVGRNDPCRCGSGKKYKKCCGR